MKILSLEPPLLTHPSLSSILSPCDMCHSLIGYNEAQFMCSSLMQSEPSMSFFPSLHLNPQTLKPLAYKLGPSPLQNNTIHEVKS